MKETEGNERNDGNEGNDVSFNSWLLDKHHKLEKTAGAVVLVIEIMDIVIHQIFKDTPDIPLTQFLNLGFLIIIYIKLEREFGKGYTLKDKDHQKVARILRLWRYSGKHQQERIEELVRSSNKLLGQLRNINYFILATAALYSLLLVKSFAFKEGNNDPYHVFHLLIDLTSYVGAFYLLRCFFVMYLPTVEKCQDVLNRNTNPYILIGVGLMVIDFCFTRYFQGHSGEVILPMGVFIAEFICGLVNAVVFVLLIARFENKILDIPPYVLVILYAYAVLQTCLPFVTNTGLIIPKEISGAVGELPTAAIAVLRILKEFSEGLSSIVFRLVLVGKVALAAVFLYVLSSGRIIYYFMVLKNLHEEENEEKHWGKFRHLLDELPRAPEPFEITYEYNPDSEGYTAMIVPIHLFGRISGSGKTLEEARENLRNKIQTSEIP